MAQLLPESLKQAPQSWKKALEQLREDIHGALDRWLHRRSHNGNGAVPVRVSGGVDGGDGRTSFPGVFTNGGPPIDVEDNGDELVLLAEMPGLNREDFAVEVLADRVILRGQKKLRLRSAGRASSSRNGSLAALCALSRFHPGLMCKSRNQAASIGLNTADEAGQLQVRWDADAGAVRSATVACSKSAMAMRRRISFHSNPGN